MNNVTLLKLHG